MTALRLSVLFTILVLSRFERTDGISYKNMDDYCWSRISMNDDNQLSLYISGNEECEVTITTTSHFPNMMLYFQRFLVDCLYGTVTIRNQYGEPSSGLPESFCGNVSSSQVYTHNGDVKIKFIPENRWTYASFSLIVTLYSDSSTCERRNHVCANGRCIDPDLKCNGYNSCGDNSGCSDVNIESSGTGVSIGVGISVGVTIFIIVTVTIICYRRKPIGIPTQRTHQTALASPTAPPMHDVYASPNPDRFNQGFSNRLYSNQHTTEHVPRISQLHDQLPPPYDPAWAPRK